MSLISLESSFSAVPVMNLAECNNLLAYTAKVLADVTFKRSQIDRAIERNAERSVTVQADIDSSQAELDNVVAVIANLAEGDLKNNFVDKQKTLEYRLYRLNRQSVAGSSIGVTKNEGLAQSLELQAQLYADLKASVESRKAAL